MQEAPSPLAFAFAIRFERCTSGAGDVRSLPSRRTQQDPIGLAGGLNLYGYGDGDPINNSDPFGLRVDPVTTGTAIVVAAGTAVASEGTALVTGVVAGGVALAAGGGALLKGAAVLSNAIEGATGVSLGETTSSLQAAALRAEFPKIRRDYWKNEAATRAEGYSKQNVERMKSGRPPIGSDGYPMELHHKVSLKNGGTNDLSNLEQMTQTDHRRGDNYKKNHPEDE